LQVDGSIANVSVNSTNSPASLSGKGTVGTVTGQPPVGTPVVGTVAPGDNANASPAGILNSTGETWGTQTKFFVNLGDTTVNQSPVPGTDYDQLKVTGNLSLGGATLQGSLINAVPVGDKFTIIQTTGTLSGTFAQGSTVFIGGNKFSITYNTPP